MSSFLFVPILLCLYSSLDFCFLLYSSGLHGDLHSFPTRRSSDLLIEKPDAVVRNRIVLAGTRMYQVMVEGQHNPVDRKSTRLNSSHRCISYAVFCLKKKNIGRIFKR